MNGNNIRQPEQQIVREAVEALHRTTGLIVEVLPATFRNNLYPDLLVRIIVPGQKQDWRFPTEVKATLTRATLGVAVGQLTLFRQKMPTERNLLITRYVTPQMAEELKEKGVQFIDTAGNTYLNDPPLFVFVKGNRPRAGVQAEDVKRAFRPAGLQIVFALLCIPELVNAPYRAIAKTAAVALGTVGWAMRDLKQLGYLVDMGPRGRRLTRKKELLDRWVTAYPDQLRPKQMFGRFKAADYNWWQRVDDLRVFNGYWGGETGAALLTRFLKPQVATIYMRGDPHELILKYHMRKDPDGDIEILKAFWNLGINHDYYGAIVPPLLIYADLLATGDPRNIETAKLIYEREIVGLIREN